MPNWSIADFPYRFALRLSRRHIALARVNPPGELHTRPRHLVYTQAVARDVGALNTEPLTQAIGESTCWRRSGSHSIYIYLNQR